MLTRTKYDIKRHYLRRSPAQFIFVFVSFFVVMMCKDGFAQLKEEIEEKKPARIEIESLQREVREEKKMYKLLSTLELSGSYETNPRLTSIRKGDSAGHLKYSFLFKRPLFKGVLLNFNYNFDGTGYSELNELTNLLNHTRLSLDKSVNKHLGFGIGYDFSSFYYPQEPSSDFYFHKGFFYVKHNISKKFYHQVMWEEGFKGYIHSPAYEHSTTIFQDVDRQDYRHGIEHSVGLTLTEKMFFRFRTKYSINDSNAFYQDYNDYKSWDFAPYLNYQISEKYSINLSMTFTDKEYKNRLVAAQDYERHDQIYNGSVGLRYKINTNNTLSLGYGYDESHSNDPTTEYTGSTFNGGWQYKF